MYRFPKGFYTDVRIEDVFETKISVTNDNLDEKKETEYEAAFIRLYDGKRWFYASTTDLSNIQSEIDKLSKMATINDEIENNPVVKKFQVNEGEFYKFEGEDNIREIDINKKYDVISDYFDIVKENEFVKLWKANYVDLNVRKSFFSSKGSKLFFDYQKVGYRISWQLADGDERFDEGFDVSANTFEPIKNKRDKLQEKLDKSIHFLKNAESVEPGKYTIVLSPMAAGVFAHESFGHKSESDFMIGDKTMREEWKIGKKVGSDILNIVDDGNLNGNGFVPFDDEGSRAEETFLIKEGKLAGRLHSVETAVDLNEELTGNARAINFEFEPIVRMTNTYIKAGSKTFEELISEIDEGILVDTIAHGSGMSTFTIAPRISYYIKNGKIDKPVKISVITGNVFETLNEIDGLSDKLEILSFTLGGCGKMEQFPLPVGFGGPYVRVRNLNVQ